MNFEEARAKVKAAYEEREAAIDRRRWEAFNEQNRLIDQIGEQAYSRLFGGYTGTPGPRGVPSNLDDILDEAARLMQVERALEEVKARHGIQGFEFVAGNRVNPDLDPHSLFVEVAIQPRIVLKGIITQDGTFIPEGQDGSK